jgi:hypothetical protein
MKKCHKCGAVVEVEKVSRRDECPSCGSDLRVCLNCSLYDPNRANECFEPQVEKVKEKERANYCDFFTFREEGSVTSAKTQAEKLWQGLFKKNGS